MGVAFVGHPYYSLNRVKSPSKTKDAEEHEMEALKTMPTHAHHWLIAEANGPRSSGYCKTCGALKEFKNWLEDGDFITNEEHRIAA